MLQHCDVCERVVFYPRIVCPYCFATSLSWVEASGRGEIYSFSVVWHPQNAAFDSSVPIVLAVVALEEGVQMVSVVVDRRPEEVAIGMKVSVGFQSLGDGVSLPVFVSAG